MNIFLILDFPKCKSGIDIERNGESEEEKKALIAHTENKNLDCSDKGKNAISTLPL